MNNLLELKGKFDQKKRNGGFAARTLPKQSDYVSLEHLKNLMNQLIAIRSFWAENKILNNCLFSVYYKDIIAKSNRIQTLFSKDVENTNSTIVGAKYIGEDTRKHVITHCISHVNLQDSIDKLISTIDIVEAMFGDKVFKHTIDDINKKVIEIPDSLSKTKFIGVLVDCFYVENLNKCIVAK